MDVTTVSLGTSTRNDLANFRDEEGYPNYDEAVAALLEKAGEQ